MLESSDFYIDIHNYSTNGSLSFKIDLPKYYVLYSNWKVGLSNVSLEKSTNSLNNSKYPTLAISLNILEDGIINDKSEKVLRVITTDQNWFTSGLFQRDFSNIQYKNIKFKTFQTLKIDFTSLTDETLEWLKVNCFLSLHFIRSDF